MIRSDHQLPSFLLLPFSLLRFPIQIFNEVGAEYPDIEKEHWIVDIGAAKLADTPEAFDVIVLPNLYGDILSDVAAQIAGSVGLAGSANIGSQIAMFEASKF